MGEDHRLTVRRPVQRYIVSPQHLATHGVSICPAPAVVQAAFPSGPWGQRVQPILVVTFVLLLRATGHRSGGAQPSRPAGQAIKH
jgi:hypothetical protein